MKNKMNAKILQFTIFLIFIVFLPQSYAAIITSLNIIEKAGVSTSNYPLTFGHVFKKGDVTNSIRVLANGQPLTTQFDVKRHYNDGSVKHGVISVLIPNIAANSTVSLTIETTQTNHNSGAMSKSAILSTGFDSQINLTNLSGSGYSGSVSASFKNAASETEKLNYWLKGPVCTEVIVNKQLNNSLHASWEARFYPGSNFGARISSVMENVEANFRGNINYSVSIRTGVGNLSTAFSKDSFQHNESSRWKKTLWIGSQPPEVEVHYDLPYMITTGAIMNYNTSLNIPESILTSAYSRWKSTNRDIMGNGILQEYFPTTGGREDIGILPTWTVRYLLSMDNRMREIMLNSADMAAGCPIHYREHDQAKNSYRLPVSVKDRPSVITTSEYAHTQGTSTDRLPAPIGATNTTWAIDRAHQGSFAFIPYLITGDHFYMTEMIYWAAYNISSGAYDSNWGRDYSRGLIRDQVRGEAWAIRNIADAAAFANDESYTQQYLEEIVNNNIAEWMSEKDRYPLNNWGIDSYAQTSGMRSGIKDVTSPWMEDFMLLSLHHMKLLGFKTEQIIDWYSQFIINRFSHPDFNWYNGPGYRFPAVLSDGSYPRSWADANAAYIDQPSNFPIDDYPISQRYIALAALSCTVDYSNGEKAYHWLSDRVNDKHELNEDPTWAIIPILKSNRPRIMGIN